MKNKNLKNRKTWSNKKNNRKIPNRRRAKQKEFITEQAGLSKKEAAKFFPVYFELQDKKKKLNDESWDLMRKNPAH